MTSGIEPSELKIGDRVFYHPVIGEAHTGVVHKVRAVDVDMYGGVAWLVGKAGFVSCEALSRVPPEADWQPIATAPVEEVVETKIDDEHGERNVCTLKRIGQLWFTPDARLHVYYVPTHWRPLQPGRKEAEQ